VVWGGEFGRTPMQENREGKKMPFKGRVQLHPRTEIEKNILSKECLEIMQRFFRKKR
jgi:hypothetical protein